MCDEDCGCASTELPFGPPGPPGPQGPKGDPGDVPIDLNYLAKGTGPSITESQLFDNGVDVGVNTISPTAKFHIKGDSSVNSDNILKISNDSDVDSLNVDGAGNVSIGSANLSLSATDGFLFVPSCLGVPIGVPTSKTGTSPIVIDNTNNALYFYSGGAWRTAGGWALNGNAGTTAGTNFIGTTDSAEFMIKTDNSERASFSATDINFVSPLVGIGETSFIPTSTLDVRGQIRAVLSNGVGIVYSDTPFKAVRPNLGNPDYYSGMQYDFEVGGASWGIGHHYQKNTFGFFASASAKFTFGSGTPASPNNSVTFETAGQYGFYGFGNYSGNYNFEIRATANLINSYHAFTLDDVTGTLHLRVLRDGYFLQRAINAPIDTANIPNSAMTYYVDQAANQLIVKVKYSTGTVKTGTISLI